MIRNMLKQLRFKNQYWERFTFTDGEEFIKCSGPGFIVLDKPKLLIAYAVVQAPCYKEAVELFKLIDHQPEKN